MYDPFDGPRAKLRWARKKIEGLEAALTAYTERVQYGFVETSPPDEPMIELRFKFSERPPEDIPMLIGDAIHNMRTALDLMVNDIGRVRQVPDLAKLAFPFATTEETFAKEMKNRKIARLGDDIATMIGKLEPYPTGNKLLWAIHEMDIVDKHQMILPVFSAVPFTDMQTGPFAFGGTMAFRPGGTIHIARGTPFKMRRSGGVTAEFDIRSPLFRGGTAIEALNEASELVEGIVKTFAVYLEANPTQPPAGPVGGQVGV